MYIRQNVNVNFLAGEMRSYYVVPYEKLHLVHEAPGIYSWHIRIKEGVDFNAYNKFFKRIVLTARVSGNLRFEYEGELTKSLTDYREPKDTSLFENLVFSVSYPIYIGISKNLNSRISVHRKQFEAKIALDKGVYRNDKAEPDSDEESSFFGGRLAELWPPGLPRHSLYVKYVVPNKCLQGNCFENCTAGDCLKDVYNDLRQCETVANDLFNPVFGRR